MNKHTPGPWVRDDGGGLKGDVRAASGKWIALCWGIGNAKNPYREEYKAVCDANARLIAAAPELLEACKTFHEWLVREEIGFANKWDRNTEEGESKWREWYDENLRLCALAQEQARAAIAKAKGDK